MKTGNDYHKEQERKLEIKLRAELKNLPPFANEFARGIQTTAIRTRLAYIRDIRSFLDFASNYLESRFPCEVESFTLKDLGSITVDDLEMYQEYLVSPSLYLEGADDSSKKSRRTIARNLSSLRSLYRYFYNKEKLSANPLTKIRTPKLDKKEIVYLEPNESALLLDEAEYGTHLTGNTKTFHKYSKERDLALLTLLLGTGIRVSECVGINIDDIDFSVNGVSILRKGNKEQIVFFNDEVAKALSEYLVIRKKTIPNEGHEDALFLSNRKQRISVRTVQYQVDKYSKYVAKLKNISPHKLRSSFGTNLYRETGDIYLVKEALNHSDISTTVKYYAEMSDERRREVPKHTEIRGPKKLV